MIDRRGAYEPQWPQEQFIVPLLRDQIAFCLREFAQPVASQPGTRTAIDVGCGHQPLRSELEHLGFAYYSFDVAAPSGISIDFLGTLDGRLPDGLTAQAPFDFVLCTEVLEHVADWNAAFQNLAQITAAGSIVLITCPFFYQLHEQPHDFWRPTRFALDSYAERYGFAVVRNESAGTAWDVLGTLLPNAPPEAVSDSIRDRLLARLVKFAFRVAFVLLKRRIPQRYVRLRGSLYLSNVVVLRRR
jgi:SAM-dependent methyltransferase